MICIYDYGQKHLSLDVISSNAADDVWVYEFESMLFDVSNCK